MSSPAAPRSSLVPRVAAIVAVLLVLAIANYAIASREAVLRDGTTVRLALAPVDPRSLMQGDYMRLAFALENEIDAARATDGEAADARVRDGYAVVVVGEQGVSRLERIERARDGVRDGEVAIRFRERDLGASIGTDAWFFEEGSAARFERAAYGEFRVARDGTALLVRMLGPDGEPL